MTEVVWAILRRNKRFLLTQRSFSDHSDSTWTFPGGQTEISNSDIVTTIHRKLKTEVGLEGHRFRKLFHICLEQSKIQVFLCDQWNGELKPGSENIIGVGWFTYSEMYALGQSLAPFVNDSLSYLSYLIQHYDHHPNEWKNQWRKM